MSLAVSVRRARVYLDAIRFEHTIFALPFAYLGMVLAARGWPGWPVFIWTTLAMAGARTGAMAANRLIDAEMDARNPRRLQGRSQRGLCQDWRCWGWRWPGSPFCTWRRGN